MLQSLGIDVQNSNDHDVIVIKDDENSQTNCNDHKESITVVNQQSGNDIEMFVSTCGNTTETEDLVDIIKESLETEHSVSDDALLKLTILSTEREARQVFTSLSESLNVEAVSILGTALCSFQKTQPHVIQFYFRCLLLPKVGKFNSVEKIVDMD